MTSVMANRDFYKLLAGQTSLSYTNILSPKDKV
jgi:hypothetical protein